MKNDNVFETSDLDLGAFLMLKGLPFIGCQLSFDTVKSKPRAKMRFIDEKGKARDLERIFMTSDEKKYRDITKYLLKEVHQSVRDYANTLLD